MIDIEETIFDERPKTRSDCVDAERPCPWVGCKYHLYLDVTEKGSLRLNYPNNEPWDLMDSCALDLAERDGMTLEEVGNVLCVSKERVRQLEHRGLRLLRRSANSREEMEELEPHSAL